MSKRAEDFALKKWPVLISHRSDINSSHRFACIQGYEQAEKDLALTWEDVKEICVQSVLVEIDLGGHISDERHYTEVLKRFNEQRNKQ